MINIENSGKRGLGELLGQIINEDSDKVWLRDKKFFLNFFWKLINDS